jgi:hypothetical protein
VFYNLIAFENGPLAPCTIALVMNESAAANVGLAVVVDFVAIAADDPADDEDADDPLPTRLETISLKMGATSLSTLGCT